MCTSCVLSTILYNLKVMSPMTEVYHCYRRGGYDREQLRLDSSMGGVDPGCILVIFMETKIKNPPLG